MTEQYRQHAEKVVAGFKSILGDELSGQLGDEHLGELALLIESAIGNSILEELEKAADQLDLMADGLRRHAERGV